MRRLEKDAERGVGRLRLVAAVLSTIGALWLLALTRFAPAAIVVAVLVAIAARFWVVRWARVERTPAPALTLDEAGLALGDEKVAWRDVARIELDQDHLLVRVVRVDGTTLEIEPPYGGMGLDDLGRTIDGARRTAAG